MYQVFLIDEIRFAVEEEYGTIPKNDFRRSAWKLCKNDKYERFPGAHRRCKVFFRDIILEIFVVNNKLCLGNELEKHRAKRKSS